MLKYFIFIILSVFLFSCTKYDLPSAGKTNKVDLATSTPESITASSAILGGVINYSEINPVLDRGICWSASSAPTLNNGKVNLGSGIGRFSGVISNLIPGTTYYCRAYARTSLETVYGPEVSFRTLTTILPVVILNSAVRVSQGNYNLSGNVTNSGGSFVTNKGICISNQSNPTVNNSIKVLSAGAGPGNFSFNVSGFTINTIYYYRAFAINSSGTAYSEIYAFTAR